MVLLHSSGSSKRTCCLVLPGVQARNSEKKLLVH